MSRDIFLQLRVLRAPSILALSTAREGAATASLGNLGQGLTTLTGKNFFLISDLNLPCLAPLPSSLTPGDPSDPDGGFCPLSVQCVSSGQHTPSETFKIADSHPEVEDRVEPLSPTKSPLFHNKHRYQKIGVHEVSAGDGHRYNVLYLATGTGNHSQGSLLSP